MKKIILTAVAALSLFAAGCSKKAPVIIKSADDLVGKTIGVQAGTTGEIYVEDVQDAKVKSFNTGIDAALDLRNGAIDAVILDELPAKEIVKRNPSLEIVEIPFVTEDYAIAVRKGNTELLDSINKTLAAIKEDGTYDKFIDAFINTAEKGIQIPAEIPTSGEVLRMGTNAAFKPFEWVEGMKIVGFDASLAQCIARDYGRKLEIVDQKFDSLIAALEAGSVDFVAAGMTATDERRKNVDFSDPYFTSKQVIIVRKQLGN